MAKVVKGDVVKVHYTGKFESGEIFDSSRERAEPFIFKTGEEMVIPGFDAALIDMAVGDKKTVTIPATDGYGDYLEEFVLKVPRAQFPKDAELEVGMQFDLHDGQGRALPAVVSEISGDEITLDANHPLAGETLVFEIELLEIGCEMPKHEHCHDGSCGDSSCGSGGCCG